MICIFFIKHDNNLSKTDFDFNNQKIPRVVLLVLYQATPYSQMVSNHEKFILDTNGNQWEKKLRKKIAKKNREEKL